MDAAAVYVSPDLQLHGTCPKCRWAFVDGREITCRRNPPQVSIIMVPAPPPRAGQIMPQALAAFPIVHPDMWCGEHSFGMGRGDA